MTVLLLKPGVRIHGLRPETLLGIQVAHSCFAGRGLETVVTSVTDGRHSRGSLHYQGAAFDLRTRHVPADAVASLAAGIRTALGGDFDVVVEKTHLHVEYQPKDPY